MRAFSCDNCEQMVFFENSLCLRCSAPLGFLPSQMDVVVLDMAGAVRRCANAAVAECNWLLDGGDVSALCRSCRLTRTRPGDTDPGGLAAFATAEGAKRRLVFQLLELGLPLDGLSFDLLASGSRRVVTGHEDGLITVDLAESDDARREQRRADLDEPYRTLLGHFRHEVAHWYWHGLVLDRGFIDAWRALFGDERLDYDSALAGHYAHGAPADWSQHHVSAYASVHPWEDWAETFAHYLHISDTLQTAAAFGLVVAGPAADRSLSAVPGRADEARSFATIVEEWIPLTYALNAVNRSMGRGDLYPFTLPSTVIEKLGFVHRLMPAAA
jgi:hypothetical protein